MTIDIGFWPELPDGPTSEERHYLPEKSALMDQDIAEANRVLQDALDDATDYTWEHACPQEFAAVLAYLKAPYGTVQYRGSSDCRVCGQQNGSQDWFRGPFRYPQGYVHYIVEHGIKPPQAVIDAALGKSI